MNFGQPLYRMSSAMEGDNSSKGYPYTNAPFPSPSMQQHQKKFEPGGRQSTTAFGLSSPHSPPSNLMSTTGSPGMQSFLSTAGSPTMENFVSATGSPIMGNLMSTTGSPTMPNFAPTTSSSGDSFMSLTTNSLMESDLYNMLHQPDAQYGAAQPTWMYAEQQTPWSTVSGAAGMGVTLAPELPRLDTEMLRGQPLTFETHYGQPTPPEDSPQTKGPSVEAAVSASSLETDKRRMSTSKRRNNSSVMAQEIDELSPTSAKPRRQHKVQSRKNSTATNIDSEDDDKREASLARNRVAASKCREKKKKWTAGLEEKERTLRMENKILHAHKAALVNELLLLKNKALDHNDCECNPVREYLMMSAREKIEEKKQLEKLEELRAYARTDEDFQEAIAGYAGRRLSRSSSSSG